MESPQRIKVIDFPPLTDEQKSEIEALKSMPDRDIDYSDIRKHTKKDFDQGQFYYAASLKMPKTDVHVKIDTDTIVWLKQPGKGYQTRLNAALRWARMNGCPVERLCKN